VVILAQLRICIWPSKCHCHSLSVAPVNPDLFYLPGFIFLVPAHPGGPGQGPEEPQNCCVCVGGGEFINTVTMLKQEQQIYHTTDVTLERDKSLLTSHIFTPLQSGCQCSECCQYRCQLQCDLMMA